MFKLFSSEQKTPTKSRFKFKDLFRSRSAKKSVDVDVGLEALPSLEDIRCDESGYNSDSTRKSELGSPRGSILSVCSQEKIPGEFRRRSLARALKFPSKKRSRSRSKDDECLTRRKSLRLRSTDGIKDEALRMSIEDLSQACTDKLKIAKPDESSKVLDQEFHCLQVELHNDESNIGIVVKPLDGGTLKSYTVANIIPNSAADRSNKIRIGDEIVKINGVRIKNKTYQFVEKQLMALKGTVDIVVARNRDELTKKYSSVVEELKSKRDRIVPDDSLFKRPVDPLEKSKTLTGMKKFSYSHDRLTAHQSRKYSTITKTTNLSQSIDKLNQMDECRVTFCAKNEDDTSKKHNTFNRPDSYSHKTTENNKILIFHKGPGQKSLGFSIVGGTDSPKGPIGIYIKTVFPRGQAAESGEIHEGDELVSINGESFNGLTRHEAVAMFKNIKHGEVLIEVSKRLSNMRLCSSV